MLKTKAELRAALLALSLASVAVPALAQTAPDASTPVAPVPETATPAEPAPVVDPSAVAPARPQQAAVDEHAAAGEHGEEGLPQLNPANFPPQLFWLAILFALLYALMSRMALPRVAEVLQSRQERVDNDLEKAHALRAESEAVEASYKEALAAARAQAQTAMAEASAEIAALTSRRQAEIAAAVAEKLNEAEARIAAQRTAALADVKDIAIGAARQIAAKVAGVEPDAPAVETAVARALEARSR